MARNMTGVVSSDKGDKTIVVTVTTRKTHPIYKKQYSVTTKFMAHDEANDARVGDKVVIEECRPLSARKRFTLKSVVERAGVTHTEESADVTSVVEGVNAPKTSGKVASKKKASVEEAVEAK